jgi:hypothetical protein
MEEECHRPWKQNCSDNNDTFFAYSTVGNDHHDRFKTLWKSRIVPNTMLPKTTTIVIKATVVGMKEKRSKTGQIKIRKIKRSRNKTFSRSDWQER